MLILDDVVGGDIEDLVAVVPGEQEKPAIATGLFFSVFINPFSMLSLVF